jgi:hypothetical protein
MAFGYCQLAAWHELKFLSYSITSLTSTYTNAASRLCGLLSVSKIPPATITQLIPPLLAMLQDGTRVSGCNTPYFEKAIDFLQISIALGFTFLTQLKSSLYDQN